MLSVCLPMGNAFIHGLTAIDMEQSDPYMQPDPDLHAFIAIVIGCLSGASAEQEQGQNSSSSSSDNPSGSGLGGLAGTLQSMRSTVMVSFPYLFPSQNCVNAST